ncbi:MAG: hypothetical protein AAGA18_02145 [Verrucomicrobiota bacterium]
MKSAYELAMEKLEKAQPAEKLTDEQKAQITEINSLYESKIAERETFLASLIAQAEAKGDFNEVAEVQEQKVRDIAALKDEWETKKQKVWKK